MSTTPTTPANTTTPNPAQRVVQATQQAGTATAQGAGNIFTGAVDWLKNTTKDLSGWQMGGMVLGGLLAWVIGNAFGGGGLLGMIISALLVVPMAIAGRDLLSGFGQPSNQRAQAPQPNQHAFTPHQQPSHAQQRQRVNERRPGEYYYQAPARPVRFSQVDSTSVVIPTQVVAEAREAATFTQVAELPEGPIPNLRAAQERGLA